MGLSDDFIKGSNEILDQLTQKRKNSEYKKSQYSPKVFMDECKVCGGSIRRHTSYQRTTNC